MDGVAKMLALYQIQSHDPKTVNPEGERFLSLCAGRVGMGGRPGPPQHRPA